MQYYVERSKSGYVGNCLLFWRDGHCGYTCDLNNAQVFDGDDTRFVSAMKSGKYRAWPKDYMDSVATRHVDHQRCDMDQAMTNIPNTCITEQESRNDNKEE